MRERERERPVESALRPVGPVHFVDDEQRSHRHQEVARALQERGDHRGDAHQVGIAALRIPCHVRRAAVRQRRFAGEVGSRLRGADVALLPAVLLPDSLRLPLLDWLRLVLDGLARDAAPRPVGHNDISC